jgi:hypothetical protein
MKAYYNIMQRTFFIFVKIDFMTAELTTDPTIKKIIRVVKSLSDEDQKILLAQLNARQLLKKGAPQIVKKPANISMALIDKWKHESRKNAK